MAKTGGHSHRAPPGEAASAPVCSTCSTNVVHSYSCPNKAITDGGPDPGAGGAGIMPIEPTDRLPLQLPVCTDCLKPMRFIASLPDGISTALWHVMFKCDCGRTSDQVIVEADE